MKRSNNEGVFSAETVERGEHPAHRAGLTEDGHVTRSERGTPQGAVISPIHRRLGDDGDVGRASNEPAGLIGQERGWGFFFESRGGIMHAMVQAPSVDPASGAATLDTDCQNRTLP